MREFPAKAFLVGLSSIHWREAWKYGERAFRYCQHDAGHAIGALRIAAATLGWSAALLQGVADETIEDLLGLNRAEDFAGAEREHPDCRAGGLADRPRRRRAGPRATRDAATARSCPRAPTDSRVLARRGEPAQPRRAGALGGHRRSRRRNAQTGRRGAGVRHDRRAGGREQRPRKHRRPRGRTDHPAAAKPAGLRRPDAGRSRTLLPDARACDATHRSAGEPAPDALGHDGMGSNHPSWFVRSSGRRHRARAVPARSRPGQDGRSEVRNAPAVRLDDASQAARPTCRCACSKPATRSGSQTQLSCHQAIAGDGAFSLAMIAEYPGGAVHARALVLSAAVLGNGADRAGPVPRSRSGRRAGHGHRLLLRRPGAQCVRARGLHLPVALSLHRRRPG